MSIIKLSEANCRHCMRCVRICPTNAMTYINNQPIINEDECILCGKCYAICPHSAKEVSSDMTLINRWLNNGESVILSVAPSFVRLFPSFKHLKAELLKRGFAAVDETARGAKLVSEQYLALMKEGKMDNILSTCCPAAVDYVRKYFPECIKYLAPVVSPMIAHAKILKAEHPDARVVFLTPCIAKKAEIAKKELAGIVDATITMEEMMHFLNTDFYHDVPDYGEDEDPGIARIYPSGGGILKTLPNDTGYKMLHIELQDQPREGREEFGRFDLAQYTRRTFGMFGGNEETVRIRFPNKYVGVVIDRFGKDVALRPDGNDGFIARVIVAVSEQFYGWITGLGREVKIVSPEWVAEEYMSLLKDLGSVYAGEQECGGIPREKEQGAVEKQIEVE